MHWLRTQASPERFAQYMANPGQDGWFRKKQMVPEDRYYTVSVWPVAGVVTIEKRVREVKARKISKGEQG